MAEFGTLSRNVTRFLLNLSTRNLLAGVVIYCCWIPIMYYNYWFSWHVILCTLGIFPLTSEALMLFAPDELWSVQLKRKQRCWIHGCLLIAGTVLVSAGCIETFCYITEGYHLYTVHGITGLISMILFLASMFLGLCANYSQKLTQYGRSVTFKFTHNLVGLLGYLIGVVSLCYAYYTNWFVFYTSAESRAVALAATILATLWTINSSLVSGFGQLKTLLGK